MSYYVSSSAEVDPVKYEPEDEVEEVDFRELFEEDNPSPDDSDEDYEDEDEDEGEDEDLSESRPNRWTGPPSTWRAFTEQDRLTYDALTRLRAGDLSMHLYNAFALKNGGGSRGPGVGVS